MQSHKNGPWFCDRVIYILVLLFKVFILNLQKKVAAKTLVLKMFYLYLNANPGDKKFVQSLLIQEVSENNLPLEYARVTE